MPSVVNETAEQPAKLERYEVEPGVVLKMTAEDYERDQERRRADEANRAAYRSLLAGTDAPAAEAGTDVVPLTVLSKAELQELAEKRGLPTSGSKDAIAARFVAGDEAEADEPEADPDADGDAEAG